MDIEIEGQRLSVGITTVNRKTMHSFLKLHLTQLDFSQKIPHARRNAEGDQYNIKNVFAVTANEKLYMPRAMLPEFKKHVEIRGYKPNIKVIKPYKSKKCKFKLTENYKDSGPLQLREYQTPTVNSVIYNKEDPMRCYGLSPGDGKTLCSLVTAAKLGVRTVVIVRASLLDQWVEEVMETYDDFTEEDIFTVRGGDAMRELLFQTANKELTAKIICISNKTYQNYMKSFISGEDEGYIIPPTKIFSRLKIGLVILDEYHLDHHLWITLLSLSNAVRVLVLTATLISEDRFLKGFYLKILPQNKRYDPMVNDPYITYYMLQYELKSHNIPRIRYQQRYRKMYSHIELEKSILMNKEVSEGFDTMLLKLYDGMHHKRCKRNEKILVFASKVEYAEHISHVFRKAYPEIKTLTYVAGVKREEINDHSIIVATPGKASVGLDVKRLSTVINTVNMSTPAGNIQIVGRLRMPKKGESEKKFIQLNCKNIPTHGQYQNKRLGYLRERTKEIISISYGTLL